MDWRPSSVPFVQPPTIDEPVTVPDLAFAPRSPGFGSEFADRLAQSFAAHPLQAPQNAGTPLGSFLANFAASAGNNAGQRYLNGPNSPASRIALGRLNLQRAQMDKQQQAQASRDRIATARSAAQTLRQHQQDLKQQQKEAEQDPNTPEGQAKIQRDVDMAKAYSDAYQKAGLVPPAKYRQPGTGKSAKGGTSDASDIAAGIMSGTLPPTTTGNRMTQFSEPVLGELARNKYDLSKATQDWNAVSAHWKTLNGRQQTQIRQSAETVLQGLDHLEALNKQLSALIPRGRADAANKLALGAARDWGAFGPEAQNVATQLTSQMVTLQPELSNVYQAGGVPTESALKMAQKALNENMSPGRLSAAIGNERTNLKYRLNSIRSVGTLSPSNQAFPGDVEMGVPSGKVKMIDPNGKAWNVDPKEQAEAISHGWKVAR